MYSKMGKYYCTYAPGHHRATKEGYVYVHILVAEEKLGRKLKKGEVVHHVDENKLNNDPDNLIVFKTNADHAAYHKGADIYLDGDVYVAKKRVVHDIDGKKKELCPQCGALMTYGATVCRECSLKNSRKVERPNKDELFQLIKTYSFIKLGEMYGVTDNAIRKWCKYYNLPYKQKDLKLLKET